MGANGGESPEEYNNYTEFSLFTDHPHKIKQVEDRINKTKMKPWFCPDGDKKTVVASAPK